MMPKGFGDGRMDSEGAGYLAFLCHSSQRFYGLQSPREDGPNCRTSPGFGDWDVATAGEKGAASHLQRRDMKGEGEQRDQNK